ncbi:hypothetical protein AKJ57_06410 [candidate division MSBL1 archaeon SCGC-AAA259A05]|uniref:Uncharacterized protein n=1 Tax=candidate division MSBL1 archaeon SCGC-AAA259A05 TaxID=1698259 RepID=A0A133U3H6_9EURY|nr:hypothetical protein AKJ57_06410 [candidate division MSBL1 archaeon SCGC-AAA259A05]
MDKLLDSSEGLLQLSEERIFSMGPRDLSSALSYKNMIYGLGKMISVLEGNVYCVLGPDASITRNKKRWSSGFGYGGVIHWKDENVMFPEIRPNACGMLLMGLRELPDKDELIKKAVKLNENGIVLDGIEIEPDFGAGNHFFEFYDPLELPDGSSDALSSYDYFAILHGSGPELKNSIYSYAEEGERVKTPLGEITVLEDGEVDEYYKRWKELEDFSKRRRELLAERIVGEFGSISNYTHQGMFSINEARLGCYDTIDESEGNRLFPVALRWDCPVYIFEGKENLSEEILDRLEFRERAERLGLVDALKNINILPHGGGYEIGLNYQNVEVTNTNFGNVFMLSNPEPAGSLREIKPGTGIAEFGGMNVTNPRELPYTYRGKKIVRKTMELDLSDLVGKLRPLMTLKI